MKVFYIISIMIVFVLLSGCATFDAPQFKPTQYNLDLQLKIIPTEDFSKLEKKYRFEDLAGLTEFIDFKGKCDLHIPMLKEVRDPYVMCLLGHEVFHCILGTFHTDEEANTCY